MQHLRDDDGSYWTGYVYPDTTRWPVERTTWTAGAVVLAADALPTGVLLPDDACTAEGAPCARPVLEAPSDDRA